MLSTSLAPHVSAQVAPQVVAGAVGGPNMVFSFDNAITQEEHRLTIMTRRLGVPGALLSIAVDHDTKPIFSRLLAATDCLLDVVGFECKLAISDTDTYRRFVAAFSSGRSVHLEIQRPGEPVMRLDASLDGFTESYGQ